MGTQEADTISKYSLIIRILIILTDPLNVKNKSIYLSKIVKNWIFHKDAIPCKINRLIGGAKGYVEDVKAAETACPPIPSVLALSKLSFTLYSTSRHGSLDLSVSLFFLPRASHDAALIRYS